MQSNDASASAKPYSGEPPALWNPQAAAYWSLLLSPAFGAYLHMSNWQALGELKRAQSSKRWIIAVIVLLGFTSVFGAFLPDGATRAAGIALLFGWYFGGARTQTAYVKERYGAEYPRKKWLRVIAYGVLAAVAYVAAILVIFLTLQVLAKHFL